MREARTTAVAQIIFKIILFISFLNELMSYEDIYEKIALWILKITFSKIQGHNTDNSVIHFLKMVFRGFRPSRVQHDLSYTLQLLEIYSHLIM